MRLKQGVRPDNAHGLMLAVMSASQVCAGMGVDFVITSMLDGKHSANSLHYSGQAFDMRTRGMTAEQKTVLADTLRDRLNEHYDVVLEGTHLHVEFQPRGGH